MLLPLADAAAPGEGIEQHFVHVLIEGGKFGQLFEVDKHLIAAGAFRQLLEQGRMAAAKPSALGGEPAIKTGIAVNLQAVEQLPVKERAQLAQAFGRQRPNPGLGRLADLDRIDEAVRKIEPDAVAAALEPGTAGRVEDAAQLAQAPAQLAARVVGYIPQ